MERHPGAGDASRTSLGALAQELRRSSGTIGAELSDTRAVQQASARQFTALTSLGLPEVAPPQDWARGGSEHAVQIEPDGKRIRKWTRLAPEGGLGFQIGVGHGWDKATQQFVAHVGWERRQTPAEYLERIALFNRLFSDDIRFEGYSKKSDGAVVIVTSQRLLEGDHPPQADIDRWLADRGFSRVRSAGELPAAYRARDGVVLFDIKPANFIRDSQGRLHAIDVIVSRWDDAGFE